MLKIGIAGQRGLAFLKAFRTLSGIEALGAGKHVLSEASITNGGTPLRVPNFHDPSDRP